LAERVKKARSGEKGRGGTFFGDTEPDQAYLYALQSELQDRNSYDLKTLKTIGGGLQTNHV